MVFFNINRQYYEQIALDMGIIVLKIKRTFSSNYFKIN